MYIWVVGHLKLPKKCVLQVAPHEAVMMGLGPTFVIFTPAYSVNVLLLSRAIPPPESTS